MEQTNTGTVAQMLKEGLAKMDAQAATSIPDPEVEKEVQYHMVHHGLTREQAMNRVTLELLDAPEAIVVPANDGPDFDTAVPFNTPEPVHPLAVEVSTKMQGLTAEEIMAGMLPELSRLYRINGELNEAIAELRETQATLTEAIADRNNTIARTYEEVSGAYIAGQEVEQELGQAKADLILLRTELTVAVTQRDSHLNDLHVISSMLREILTRTANIQDVASHNEYYNALSRRTAIELVKELVGQATDPRDTTQSFVKRVAACRSATMQATDGGSNEQDSSTA